MIFAMRIFTEAFEWLLLRASDIKASRIIVLRFLAIFNRQKSAHELRILVPRNTSVVPRGNKTLDNLKKIF